MALDYCQAGHEKMLPWGFVAKEVSCNLADTFIR